MVLKTIIPEGLIILGYGGHARSVADVALAAGVQRLLFIDPMARANETFLDFPVIKDWPDHLPENWKLFPASGSGEKRAEAMLIAQSHGWDIGTVIAPTASIGVGSQIAKGVFIGHQAHLGPMSVIEQGALINTAAIIEHDSKVGAFAHVSVNATIAGRSSIGRFSFIGAGAAVIDKITIGDNVILGSGSVVIHDLPGAGTYVGVPAKAVESRTS